MAQPVTMEDLNTTGYRATTSRCVCSTHRQLIDLGLTLRIKPNNIQSLDYAEVLAGHMRLSLRGEYPKIR
jgi:hypothetical protein